MKIQASALSLLTRAFLCLDLLVASRHTPIMAGSAPRTNPAVSTPVTIPDVAKMLDVAGGIEPHDGRGRGCDVKPSSAPLSNRFGRIMDFN